MEVVRNKNVIRAAVIAAVILCIASAVYLFYFKPEEKPFTGSGKIDIGGYSLYIKSAGEGEPTVVFDSGYGMTYTAWYNVLKGIQAQTRTVVYSRAGIGGSDKSPLDRSCGTKAEELHKLLKAAKFKGPYILVGHSLGGFDVRLFAAKYPEEVAGIILVDASHENQVEQELKNMTEEEKARYLEEEKDNAQYFTSPDGSYEDLLKSREQVREVRTAIKDIPLTVIVAQRSIDDTDGLWLELQQEVASLSTKSKLIIAEKSGHIVSGDEPEVIIDAILEMIEEVKK